MRRVDITKTFEGLNRFTDVVNALGTAGISEDEQDPEDRIRIPPRYLIRKLEWRSPEFTHLLRTLDHLHLSNRFTKQGQSSPGNWPRYRVEGRLVDPSPPIEGLPADCYDRVWYGRLSTSEREGLCEQPSIGLEIPKEIELWVLSFLSR